MRVVLFASLLLMMPLFASGCTPPPPGAISATGYQNNDYDFRVAAAQSFQDILPEGWKLDNYYRKESTYHPEGVLTPKDGDEYITKYSFDVDGDGKTESTASEYTYELRYTHEAHDGVIFLRLIPISTDQAKKRLNVLLSRYVEAVAGAGYELVKLNDDTSMMVRKQYAAAVVAEGDTSWAGRDAYAARLEVANLDQIKLDPDARKQQVELVMAHTPFRYVARRAAEGGDAVEFPMVLLAGYANQPEEFDEGLPHFRGLLSRIFVNGARGYTMSAATQAAFSAAAGDAADESPKAPAAEEPQAPRESQAAQADEQGVSESKSIDDGKSADD